MQVLTSMSQRLQLPTHQEWTTSWMHDFGAGAMYALRGIMRAGTAKDALALCKLNLVIICTGNEQRGMKKAHAVS